MKKNSTVTAHKNEEISLDELFGVAAETFASNCQLPDPYLYRFYKDLEKRKIWIDDNVTSELMTQFMRQIMEWNETDKDIPVEERKPIKMYIYTNGGDLYSTIAIIDIMSLSKTPIYTYNCGIAFSAGVVLLLAGHRRFALNKSSALIHSGSGGTMGTYEQNQAQMKAYNQLVETMKKFIIEKTNIDAKKLKKEMISDWYIFNDDQKTFGIVDEMIDSIDVF